MAEANVSIVQDVLYVCINCRKKYLHTERLFIAVSSQESSYSCIRCEKAFQSGFVMKIRNSSSDQRIQCEDCGVLFRSHVDLLHHSYEHSRVWPQRCSYCQVGFAVDKQLAYHIKEKDVYCFKCLEDFRVKMCPELYHEHGYRLMCEKCFDGSILIESTTSTVTEEAPDNTNK
ncbi:hypothetical protein TNCV_2231461 [Trichonephila clavipes]|nr:hypothetical protein TNCV_2231461 [Trichonephila clavipes]